jgi:hypothetical protein
MKELMTRSTRMSTSMIDNLMVSDWLVGDNSIDNYYFQTIIINQHHLTKLSHDLYSQIGDYRLM